jgi:16S rRNA (uracil1498-N3)-methyltransferase
MDSNNLRNIELYYSPLFLQDKNRIKVEGEELNHIQKVMRHMAGDELYITDGKGSIYKTAILKITHEYLMAGINQEYKYVNTMGNLIFCIPKLKSLDRFENALEKCTELGVTNFIVFESERTFSRGDRTERWNKVITAAMKQSLRSFMPTIKLVPSLKEIAAMEGSMIVFSQEAKQAFNRDTISNSVNYYFIFGPEGDFSDNEMNLFGRESFFNLGNNRLRSETAVIKCASILSEL